MEAGRSVEGTVEKGINAENTTLLTAPVIAKERDMEVIRTPRLGRIWTLTEQAISRHCVPILYVNGSSNVSNAP